MIFIKINMKNIAINFFAPKPNLKTKQSYKFNIEIYLVYKIKMHFFLSLFNKIMNITY